MSRYPYTYAADMLRSLATSDDPLKGCSLSRSDAAAIRRFIADTIGMNDMELARKLADRYCQQNGLDPAAEAAKAEGRS